MLSATVVSGALMVKVYGYTPMISSTAYKGDNFYRNAFPSTKGQLLKERICSLSLESKFFLLKVAPYKKQGKYCNSKVISFGGTIIQLKKKTHHQTYLDCWDNNNSTVSTPVAIISSNPRPASVNKRL